MSKSDEATFDRRNTAVPKILGREPDYRGAAVTLFAKQKLIRSAQSPMINILIARHYPILHFELDSML